MSKSYSYIIVDKTADTPGRRQVIADVFRNCVSYNITGVDSAVSVTKQKTKTIDLQEDSVRKIGDNNSKILNKMTIKVRSSFTWANVSLSLFKMSFEKQGVVVIFQLAGYCGVYIVLDVPGLRLPALHYSVDFIFLSFGIMGFIVEL